MDNALTILRFVLPVVFGAGTVFTLLAVRRAPIGREDEEGFHYVESTDTLAARTADTDRAVPSNGLTLNPFFLPTGGR